MRFHRKKILVVLASALIASPALAAHVYTEEDHKKDVMIAVQDLNRQVGKMSYDEAITFMGMPQRTTYGSDIFVVEWLSSSTVYSLGVGPRGEQVYVPRPLESRLLMTFSKKSRLLMGFEYD